MSDVNPVKRGLVLPGGGAKGAFQFGCLTELEKHVGLDYFSAISGTSVGSINGALWAFDQLEPLGKSLWSALSFESIYPPIGRYRGLFARQFHTICGATHVVSKLVNYRFGCGRLDGYEPGITRLCATIYILVYSLPVIVAILLDEVLRVGRPEVYTPLGQIVGALSLLAYMCFLLWAALRELRAGSWEERRLASTYLGPIIPIAAIIAPLDSQKLSNSLQWACGLAIVGSAALSLYLLLRIIHEMQPKDDPYLNEQPLYEKIEATLRGDPKCTLFCTISSRMRLSASVVKRRRQQYAWFRQFLMPANSTGDLTVRFESQIKSVSAADLNILFRSQINSLEALDELLNGSLLSEQDDVSWINFFPEYVPLDRVDRNQISRLVLASSALPFGIVNGQIINSRYYVDGGVSDNEPILPLLHIGADEIVVISLKNFSHADTAYEHYLKVLNSVLRIVQIRRFAAEGLAEGENDKNLDPYLSTFDLELVPRLMGGLRFRLQLIYPTVSLGNLLTGTLNLSPKYAKGAMESGRDAARLFLGDKTSRVVEIKGFRATFVN